jgi:hypothetical protein
LWCSRAPTFGDLDAPRDLELVAAEADDANRHAGGERLVGDPHARRGKPRRRRAQGSPAVKRRDELGGLIHDYETAV